MDVLLERLETLHLNATLPKVEDGANVCFVCGSGFEPDKCAHLVCDKLTLHCVTMLCSDECLNVFFDIKKVYADWLKEEEENKV